MNFSAQKEISISRGGHNPLKLRRRKRIWIVKIFHFQRLKKGFNILMTISDYKTCIQVNFLNLNITKNIAGSFKYYHLFIKYLKNVACHPYTPILK